MRILWLLLLFPSVCAAQWTDEQKGVATVAAIVMTLDFAQTRWIAKECPDRPTSCYEGNPIIGRRPSIGRVNVYFATTAIGAALLADALPSEARTAFLYTFTGVELVVVGRNKYLGYGMRF